jgi:hypothetical protein
MLTHDARIHEHKIQLFTLGATCLGPNSHQQGSLSTVRSFHDHHKLNLNRAQQVR